MKFELSKSELRLLCLALSQAASCETNSADEEHDAVAMEKLRYRLCSERDRQTKGKS